MYVNKFYVKLFYFLSGLFAIVLPCIILIATGVVSTEINGFGIDSAERIYVGGRSEIDVYEDGVLVKSFSAKTSRAYKFTILPDDTILLSTSTEVYSMDLDGNVLDTYPDKGTYNTLKKASGVFTAQNGDTYRLKSKYIWPRIVKNGDEVAYKISTGSFIVKSVLYVAVISFVVFMIINVVIPVVTQSFEPPKKKT